MILKILFLGDSNVGKSCLIKRFIDNEFDNRLSSTICIDFKIKRIKEEDLKLYMWEITSIKDCHSFFKDANGIFIFFDITNEKSFLNIQDYINAVKNYNKLNIPIIILGSKSDLNDDRKILYQDAKNFADSMNVNYFEISSKEGKIEDVQQIFNTMISEINERKEKEVKEDKEVVKKKKKCLIM
jgi:Ras-related protein Rab-1A